MAPGSSRGRRGPTMFIQGSLSFSLSRISIPSFDYIIPKRQTLAIATISSIGSNRFKRFLRTM